MARSLARRDSSIKTSSMQGSSSLTRGGSGVWRNEETYRSGKTVELTANNRTHSLLTLIDFFLIFHLCFLDFDNCKQGRCFRLRPAECLKRRSTSQRSRATQTVQSAVTWHTNSPVGGHVVHIQKSSQWSNVLQAAAGGYLFRDSLFTGRAGCPPMAHDGDSSQQCHTAAVHRVRQIKHARHDLSV